MSGHVSSRGCTCYHPGRNVDVCNASFRSPGGSRIPGGHAGPVGPVSPVAPASRASPTSQVPPSCRASPSSQAPPSCHGTPPCHGNPTHNSPPPCHGPPAVSGDPGDYADDVGDNCDEGYEQYNNNNVIQEGSQIDNQTMNTISSMRQKACNFINSESECTSASETGLPTTPKQTDQSSSRIGDNTLLGLIAGLIEYEPESLVLKQAKEKFLIQNLELLNMTPHTRKKNFLPYACEDCVDKANRFFQQINVQNQSGSCRSPSEGRENNRSTCPQQSNGGLDCSGRTRPGSGCQYQECQKPVCKNFPKMKENMKSIIEEKPREGRKRCQHVSRPKKPIKNRTRRKRKPDGPEKSESQELFEPTLKRPHENSCDRCWRYASPSRSPVNKPEQRYDPNFRKAHSCTEFVASEKREDSLETSGRPKSPCQNIRPISPTLTKGSVSNVHQSPKACSPNQNRIKSSSYETPHNQPNDRSCQRPSPLKDNAKSDSGNAPECGIIYEEGRSPRPKSYISGSGSKNVGKLSSLFGDFETTDYMPITINQRSTAESANLSKSCAKNTGQQISFKDGSRVTPKKKEASDACVQLPSTKKQEHLGSPGRTPRPQGKSGSGRTARRSVHDCRSPTPDPGSPKRPVASRPPTPHHSKSGCEEKSPPPRPRELKAARRLDFDSCDPPKTQSSDAFQEINYHPLPEPRPRSSEVKSTFGSRNYENVRPSSGQYLGQPHPIRDCRCRSQNEQYQQGNYSNYENEFTFCCHCGQKRNSYDPNYDFNCKLASDFGQNLFNENSVTNPSYGFREGNNLNNLQYAGSTLDSGSTFPFISDCSNVYDFTVGRTEKIMACPYRQYYNDKPPPRNHSYSSSYRASLLENDPPPVAQSTPVKNPPQNFSPRKYCVFYMTKGKDESSDEVEVLVEELTEKRSKEDYKLKTGLADKSKRLLDCPSDSMALRFQKGVSDSNKNPQNCRSLYF